MTFSLNMAFSDLLLLLPEIFLTCWLCVVLIVDFSFPRCTQRATGLSQCRRSCRHTRLFGVV